jgi:hypothetical protein
LRTPSIQHSPARADDSSPLPSAFTSPSSQPLSTHCKFLEIVSPPTRTRDSDSSFHEADSQAYTDIFPPPECQPPDASIYMHARRTQLLREQASEAGVDSWGEGEEGAGWEGAKRKGGGANSEDRPLGTGARECVSESLRVVTTEHECISPYLSLSLSLPASSRKMGSVALLDCLRALESSTRSEEVGVGGGGAGGSRSGGASEAREEVLDLLALSTGSPTDDVELFERLCTPGPPHTHTHHPPPPERGSEADTQLLRCQYLCFFRTSKASTFVKQVLLYW